MLRRSDIAIIVVGCILAVLIPLWLGTHSLSSLTFGNTTIDTVLLGFFAVKPILFIAYICFVIQGFRKHWGWGFANLLLSPLACIIFCFRHRSAAQIPMAIFAFGIGLLLICILCVSF
jgi:hypothetical protein